ncbi:hypothetical protein [Croceivirga thetidis]|uniref:Uncharacterized protein n=1 Tax=Croceivirga thetidis TaxID=2721623 RepID=A0ABX1GS17_9FLAO|nr:hypothetical protein [Croceivirga thetidis]NKI31821.1 hypothetical protein [Croceivirga thetidis]
MKKSTLLLALLFSLPILGFAQTEFELKPSQSMLMTGKGPGQDGTINPYAGQDCFAIVDNIGTSEVSVRVQKMGEVISTFSILGGNSFTFKLLKDQELYLDANENEMVKARVSYALERPKE